MQDARARGAFDYILKPLDFSRLARVVDAALAPDRTPPPSNADAK